MGRCKLDWGASGSSPATFHVFGSMVGTSIPISTSDNSSRAPPPFTRASMRFAIVSFAIDLGGRMVALREWLREHGLTAVPARNAFDWDIPAH
jgi:hypothetical protein